MTRLEGEQPKVSLIKEYVKSRDGVIFDKKNIGGQQILVARGGDLSRPTFFKGSANTNPLLEVD